MDAIFGFSFYPEGGIRAPFGKLIDDLSDCNVQILSVDVPSGWNVDSGPVFEKSKYTRNVKTETNEDFIMEDCMGTIDHIHYSIVYGRVIHGF